MVRMHTGYYTALCSSRDGHRLRRNHVWIERVGLTAELLKAIQSPLIKSPSPM